MERILTVTNLRTYFETGRGTVRAVDGVDISLDRGHTLGIVGESGCGKTVLALSIMRLIPEPPGRILSGEVILQGVNLLALDPRAMRSIRGKEISMIFQEPMNSLNPVLKVGDQISESIRLHEGIGPREAAGRAREMLELVRMPSAVECLDQYPHQMSGGMRQRVMIAMALACSPKLMLADEPTTALDVTIQAQILELLEEMKRKAGTSIMLITHDLGVIAESAQHMAVMYAGTIVEYGTVSEVLADPLHPYTQGLMESTPDHINGSSKKRDRLSVIPGTVPNLYSLPPGCSFQERCAFVMPVCREQHPGVTERMHGRTVRCWKYS